jgi:hypothetical protein
LNVNQDIDKLKNTLYTRKTSDNSVSGDISAHKSNVRSLDAEREIHKQIATLRTAAVTKRVRMEYMHVRIHVAIVKCA